VDGQQLLLDPGHIAVAQLLERNRANLLPPDCAAGFFFNPCGELGGRIAKCLILRKFRFSSRNQNVPIRNIVHIFRGIASAFPEKRGDDFAVCGDSGKRFQRIAERLGFKRPMPAEGAVAAADEDEILLCFPRCSPDAARDLRMNLLRFLRGKAAGVGQNVKHASRFFKAGQNTFEFPVGINIYIVHGLNAGGIVIQYDDLRRIFLQRIGKGLVHRCFIRSGAGVQQLAQSLRFHCHPPLREEFSNIPRNIPGLKAPFFR